MTHSSFCLMLLLLLASLSACNTGKADAEAVDTEQTTDTNTNDESMQDPVYEIAVRKVKAGALETFKATRATFIAELKKQEAALVDREFASFYALPEPDDTEVFIGMTKWASLEAAGQAGQELMNQPVAGEFMATLDFKAYVMVQPIEGPDFDLGNLAAKAGQVLEVAVRSVKEGEEETFNQTRRAFVDLLSEQEGALESYEFAVVSENNDRLTVGMTVYESQEAFQRIAGSIMTDAVAQNYFATFDPVALQYAVSTSND